MAQFLNDTFTDTDGVLLENHTGEVGAIWTRHPSYTGSVVRISTNRIYNNAAWDTSCYYASGVPAGADYTVTSKIYVVTDDDTRTKILGRLSITANTCYSWEGYAYADLWVLKKVIVGSETTLGYGALTMGVGYSGQFKLSMEGSTIKGYIGGIEKVSVTDSDITDAGKAGVYPQYSSKRYRRR
jgi:hypothetical protein